MSKATLTQSKELAVRLKALRKDVTAKDRQACIDQGVSKRTTISNYLNGEIRDNDTALMLYQFFKKRIEKRQKALA